MFFHVLSYQWQNMFLFIYNFLFILLSKIVIAFMYLSTTYLKNKYIATSAKKVIFEVFFLPCVHQLKFDHLNSHLNLQSLSLSHIHQFNDRKIFLKKAFISWNSPLPTHIHLPRSVKKGTTTSHLCLASIQCKYVHLVKAMDGVDDCILLCRHYLTYRSNCSIFSSRQAFSSSLSITWLGI